MLPVGFGGGVWWPPLGIVGVLAALTVCCVLWRVRTLWRAFGMSWVYDAIDRAEWPPRAVELVGNATWTLGIVTAVAAWMR